LTGGLSFELSCVPPRVTHQSKRIVRVGKFSRLADAPELKAAHALLDTLLLPYQPAAPLTGPVSLTLTFTWPWLASDSKKVRALGRIPHAKKPDADNAAKGVTDRMAALRFLEDDGQVVELLVRKFRGASPGIAVAVWPARTEGEK
jgi:Holliday junction resolvase RusA-like endonuclease